MTRIYVQTVQDQKIRLAASFFDTAWIGLHKII